MIRRFLGLFLSLSASAQVLTFPSQSGGVLMNTTSLNVVQSAQMDLNLFTVNSNNRNASPLETPSGSVSNLDLKAPGKARREYTKGYQLLMGKDLPGAISHLLVATSIYPSFVAAHNALGSAYLSEGQTDQARTEFAKAVTLDDHLPNSLLNLGCAELALKHYPAAEDSIRKASAIAPLDLQLQIALAYGQFMNHDYPAVVATAERVHGSKHQGASVVHFFAAGALEAQDNLTDAQHELEVLLQEDPKSPSAAQFQQILQQIKDEERSRADAKLTLSQPVTFSFQPATAPSSEAASLQAQWLLQSIKEKNQIAEAEAEPDPKCGECGKGGSSAPVVLASSPERSKNHRSNFPGTTLRASVDEVAVFFAATDHGKSVTDLAPSDVGLRDDSQPPAAILSFRNEAQLPLRLGLIIDTSNSITSRFSFEQKAAASFLNTVVNGKDDLAFVIGVNNSVLLVQDLTEDQSKISRAISELAPAGGTALWDAIAFAAEKLSSRPEVQPVARVLVVISDGEDNSSHITFKQAIETAQRGEIALYTVSTRDGEQEEGSALLGDHALRTLADLTGGAAFTPGSIHRLNGSLAELQQVIRGRYLVSYKPASFQRNGHYRSIDIAAKKDGRKLKIYARKGYYASVEARTAER